VESETESALMRRLQLGETGSAAVLFERHHLPLFRYLLGLTGNRALAEDLVQEVFLRVIKHCGSYNPEFSFTLWMYGVARNAYFDLYRKRKREVPDEELAESRSLAPLPEEIMSREQDLEFLQEALRRLPENKREVLILSRYQNLQYSEIGKLLGCEVGAVKLRVFRALKELRQTFCELRKEKVYDA
jgi:RNA polymerase sigma factor (sigma-70 family)